MSRPFDATIMVLAKAPRAGRVKTRLCPPCTPDAAASIAAAALADTLATVAAVPVARRVLVLDGPVGPWVHPSFTVVPQCGGDLGDRLTAAFARVEGPALLVGMDTPQVTAFELEDALRDLASPVVDAVLGPACDGGWWSLGLTRTLPGVFERVPMSTSDTGRAQLARLTALRLRTRLLGVRVDVDHFPDALAVADAIPDSRFAKAVGAAMAEVGAA